MQSLRFNMSDMDSWHTDAMKKIEDYEGTELHCFRDDALHYADGMREVVVSDWESCLDSAVMFERFLFHINQCAIEGRGPICYPVIDGIPRLCFLPKNAPVACYLTHTEKNSYVRGWKPSNKITYLETFEDYRRAAFSYLENKYDLAD